MQKHHQATQCYSQQSMSEFWSAQKRCTQTHSKSYFTVIDMGVGFLIHVFLNKIIHLN